MRREKIRVDYQTQPRPVMESVNLTWRQGIQ